MIRLAAFMVFIVSAAMAAGGIILSSRLRSRHNNELFSALIYFQVFIFTFGFYGIWGHIILSEYISPYITGENVGKLSDFLLVLGLPFAILAMLMLIRIACFASGRICSNSLIALFLIVNFVAVAALGYVIAGNDDVPASSLPRIYFIVLNSASSLIFAILTILSSKKSALIGSYDRKISGTAVAAIMILQSTLLIFNDPYIGLLFVILYFTGSAFLPVYLTYKANLHEVMEEPARNITFEEFCRKHEVSPRESEIIKEICNGLSNKEIAEKLFISLQTVKDHTHRIYIKTNVRSRAQLMTLVNEGTSLKGLQVR